MFFELQSTYGSVFYCGHSSPSQPSPPVTKNLDQSEIIIIMIIITTTTKSKVFQQILIENIKQV
jgi:hypothetical protein